jgi:hypothetical protein
MNKNFHLLKRIPNRKTIFIFLGYLLGASNKLQIWDPHRKIKNKMTSFNKNSSLKQNKKEKGSKD